jgi:hypothetical protein
MQCWCWQCQRADGRTLKPGVNATHTTTRQEAGQLSARCGQGNHTPQRQQTHMRSIKRQETSSPCAARRHSPAALTEVQTRTQVHRAEAWGQTSDTHTHTTAWLGHEVKQPMHGSQNTPTSDQGHDNCAPRCPMFVNTCTSEPRSTGTCGCRCTTVATDIPRALHVPDSELASAAGARGRCS